MVRKMKTVALAVAMLGAGGAAMAGTCPAEHVLTEPREIEGVGTKWLTREVIANVRLEGWREMGGFLMRQRRLELAPGGRVPTHSHADRPAIVYLAKGTVTEHNSFCAVPIVHHAGTPSEEFGVGFVHYWENTGPESATFISTDVVPFPSDGTPYYGWEGGVSPEEQYGR